MEHNARDLNDDETIDAAAVALLLHCETKTVEALARSGALPATKFGKGWIFLRSQVLQAVARRAAEEAESRKPAATRKPADFTVEAFSATQSDDRRGGRRARAPLPLLPSREEIRARRQADEWRARQSFPDDGRDIGGG